MKTWQHQLKKKKKKKVKTWKGPGKIQPLVVSGDFDMLGWWTLRSRTDKLAEPFPKQSDWAVGLLSAGAFKAVLWPGTERGEVVEWNLLSEADSRRHTWRRWGRWRRPGDFRGTSRVRGSWLHPQGSFDLNTWKEQRGRAEPSQARREFFTRPLLAQICTICSLNWKGHLKVEGFFFHFPDNPLNDGQLFSVLR